MKQVSALIPNETMCTNTASAVATNLLLHVNGPQQAVNKQITRTDHISQPAECELQT